MRMRAASRLVLLAFASTALTLATIFVSGTRLEVQDWDCPPAPASCARPVTVGGFPLPWVSDYHGISPVGSVSLTGAILGEDHFHAGAFVADVACFLVAGGALMMLASRATRRRRQHPSA